jgi:serine-type D-Ala-D-Ala carboxypeptidase (penicillin-binding protein 5/6)
MKKKIAFIVIAFLLLNIPFMKTVGASTEKPNIISEAGVLLDAKSGAVLYEKNAQASMYPASLTKIATAIYAIEKGILNDQVVVSAEATQIDGTRVYLEEGEVVTLEHLIQGMLINSGNDAAAAIALHLDGSMEQFEKNINDYLHTKIGVENTHFTNPHGLFDEKHYTTAYDLGKITNYALRNPVFKAIFSMKELPWDGESWDTTLITHHLMLKGEQPYEGVVGGKTGFVNESKQTLATTAENSNLSLTAIVLKTDYKKDIYQDTKLLLDYGFQHFKTEALEKTTYTLGSKTFYNDGLVFITKPLSEYIQDITSDGKLQILSSNGELIQSVQLKEKIVETVQEENESTESSINFSDQNTFLIIAALSVTTLLVGIKKMISVKMD